MSDAPLVTVSCTAYNHEKFIRDALEGFIMQKTNFRFEVIVHDDASTDNTAEIIREYEIKYPAIIKPIYQKENQWSKGIKPSARFVWPKARGKYLALCEGDDYWTDPLKLQKQVDFLQANKNYAGAFHYTKKIIEGYDISKDRLYGFHGTKLDFESVDTISPVSPWHTSSFVFRNEFLEIPSWFYSVPSGDMALFSIISKYGKIRCIPEIMSVYRKNEGGVTKSATHMGMQLHKNRLKLMHHLNQFHEFKYNQKARKIIKNHKIKILKANLRKLQQAITKIFR